MNTVSVETLRSWLDEGQAVSVVDVRSLDERQEWAIPGSIYIDAYTALKAHDPQALATLALPADRPVVTVCATGKTSQIAAAQLAARGLQVFSLEGGMRAWSLAWNTARVPLAEPSIQVIQVRRTGKGCLSYLIGARRGSRRRTLLASTSCKPWSKQANLFRSSIWPRARKRARRS